RSTLYRIGPTRQLRAGLGRDRDGRAVGPGLDRGLPGPAVARVVARVVVRDRGEERAQASVPRRLDGGRRERHVHVRAPAVERAEVRLAEGHLATVDLGLAGDGPAALAVRGPRARDPHPRLVPAQLDRAAEEDAAMEVLGIAARADPGGVRAGGERHLHQQLLALL